MNILFFVFIAIFANSYNLQTACVTSDDCTTGNTCYSVTSTTGNTCTAGAGGVTTAITPYQECLSADDVASIDLDTNCQTTEITATTCSVNSDCSAGECCISSTCTDEDGTPSSSTYICADYTSSGSSGACSWGSCVSDDIETMTRCYSQCLTDQCCGTILTSEDTSTSPYCVPTADGNGQTYFNIGSNSYKGLCDDPSAYTCVADDPNNDSKDSECVLFNIGDYEYCCAVKTSTPDGSYVAGATGVCEAVDDVEVYSETADTNGEYTVCFAITLLSGIAYAFSLF